MTGRRLILWLAGSLGAAWALYAMVGKVLTGALNARFGARILKMGGGKTTDSHLFIQMRLHEAMILLTAAILITMAHLVAVGCIKRKSSPRGVWIFSALSGFVCLNAFSVVAAHTVLFWCLLFTGTGKSHNYTQYQIKKNLMREVQAPKQAVLFGSSQTRAEIDEDLLNERIGAKLWTTELHFPGDKVYDMLLSFEDLSPLNVDYVICYLSENYFYTDYEPEGAMYFQNFSNLPEFYRLGGGTIPLTRSFAYGLLGDVVPLFRLRDPLLYRILGHSMMNLSQEEWNKSLEVNLAQRAKAAAPEFHFGPGTIFQKQAFGVLADKCRKRHAALIVCCGQMNPLLGRAIDPSVRADMIAFLHEQAARDTNIVLLTETQMPLQTDKDYDDLTHVNPATQARFSEYIAGVLGNLLRTSKPPGQSLH